MEETKNGGPTLGQFAAGVIVLFLLVSMCSSDDDNPTTTTDASKGTPSKVHLTDAELLAANAGAAKEDGSSTSRLETALSYRWNYGQGVDDITGKAWHHAEITSDDYNRLSWPYEGDTYLTITVRKHPRFRGDVAFRVDRGQILCSSYDGCAGAISIDGKAEKLTLAEPADNSSDVVFAAYDAAIIRKLKGAKKVVVELPMYRNGNVSWTFSAEGLEWPPKG